MERVTNFIVRTNTKARFNKLKKLFFVASTLLITRYFYCKIHTKLNEFGALFSFPFYAEKQFVYLTFLSLYQNIYGNCTLLKNIMIHRGSV